MTTTPKATFALIARCLIANLRLRAWVRTWYAEEGPTWREESLFMPPTLQALGIDRLSVEDRIALALAIWDSVAAGPHPPLLTDAQRQELQRRVADANANPDDVVPWEQVKAEALARFQCSTGLRVLLQ
jgi:putative addiction module component (TIGR02574 family)